MKSVFVLTWGKYEDYEVIGIYTTKQKAKEMYELIKRIPEFSNTVAFYEQELNILTRSAAEALHG